MVSTIRETSNGSELAMVIETPTLSTEQSTPTPNGVLPNQVVYGGTNTDENSKPAPSHVNGAAGQAIDAVANPELAFDSIESTISAFSTENWHAYPIHPSLANTHPLSRNRLLHHRPRRPHPRKRRRPHLRSPGLHPRESRLHDPPHQRPDLQPAVPGPRPLAGSPTNGALGQEQRGRRHGVYRLRRRRRRGHDDGDLGG